MHGSKRIFWTIWAVTAALSFLAFFVGVKFILGSILLPRNIFAFAVFGILFGALAAVLYLFRLKMISASLIIGLVVGFGLMYRVFWIGMSGWEDLAGFYTLFVWVGVSLSVGIVLQAGRWIYFRLRGKNEK